MATATVDQEASDPSFEQKSSGDIVQLETEELEQPSPEVPYRVYKWRFVGLVGMVSEY
jgi:hypothetical protein